jgi:hypothetical protein
MAGLSADARAGWHGMSADARAGWHGLSTSARAGCTASRQMRAAGAPKWKNNVKSYFFSKVAAL